MKRLLPLLLLAAACGKGDGLVVVTLDSTAQLAGITRFAVTATVGTTTRTFDVTPPAAVSIPPTFDFGIRVPPKLGKSIDLTVVANAGTTKLAEVRGFGDVAAGKRTTATLVFGAPPPDLSVRDQAIADLTVPPSLDFTGVTLDLTPPEGADLLPADNDLATGPSCDEATCGPCTDCGGGGACTKLVLSADDDKGQTCNGSSTCSATGVCKVRQGFTCVNDSDCTTNNCVDSVCCNVPANQCGQCQQCNRVGFEGTCTAAADGTDPDNECGDYNCRGGQCAGYCNCPSTTDMAWTGPCNNASDSYTGGSPPTLDCKAGTYCVGSGYTCVQKKCSGSCSYHIQCGNNSCPYPSLMCGC